MIMNNNREKTIVYPPEKCSTCKKYKTLGYTWRSLNNPRKVWFECYKCYKDRRMIEEL